MLIEGIVSFSCVYPIQGNTIHKETNRKIPVENLLLIENSYKMCLNFFEKLGDKT